LGFPGFGGLEPAPLIYRRLNRGGFRLGKGFQHKNKTFLPALGLPPLSPKQTVYPHLFWWGGTRGVFWGGAQSLGPKPLGWGFERVGALWVTFWIPKGGKASQRGWSQQGGVLLEAAPQGVWGEGPSPWCLTSGVLGAPVLHFLPSHPRVTLPRGFTAARFLFSGGGFSGEKQRDPGF